MKRTLGTFATIAAALLATAPLAAGEEQTRESYKAQVEPMCKANREANERIMSGAKDRINKGKLELAGKQFIRVSASFGGLVEELAPVPPPPADAHRIDRWLHSMRLIAQRLHTVGKYYKAEEKIKATHESILAERSGLAANNISIVLHFHDCRFGHIG